MQRKHAIKLSIHVSFVSSLHENNDETFLILGMCITTDLVTGTSDT